MAPEELLSTEDAAKLAKVKRITILKWIGRGKLKAEKVGRDYVIRREDLDAKLSEKVKSKGEG